MALKTELMAGGMPHRLANQLGFDAVQTVSAAGTTQATATQLTGNFTIVSVTGANSGVQILDTSRGFQALYNAGASTLTVYGNGTQTINGIAGATGISVPTTKSLFLIPAGTGSIGVVGA